MLRQLIFISMLAPALGWALKPSTPIGSRIRASSCRRLQALGKDDGGVLSDMVDAGARPGFAIRDVEDAGLGPTSSSRVDRAAARRRRQKAGLNDRLLAEINEIESGLYQQGKVREVDIPVQEVAPLLGYTEDLQGVNPLLVFGGAGFVLASAGGMWALTTWLASQFALHPLPEDTFYVIVRVATVVRTAVVGGTALGSGIFFMTGVGLLLLSGRVAVGVASGELDMNAPQTLARKGLTVDEQLEKMKRLMGDGKKKE